MNREQKIIVAEGTVLVFMMILAGFTMQDIIPAILLLCGYAAARFAGIAQAMFCDEKTQIEQRPYNREH